jgi:hypothetical protein
MQTEAKGFRTPHIKRVALDVYETAWSRLKEFWTAEFCNFASETFHLLGRRPGGLSIQQYLDI